MNAIGSVPGDKFDMNPWSFKVEPGTRVASAMRSLQESVPLAYRVFADAQMGRPLHPHTVREEASRVAPYGRWLPIERVASWLLLSFPVRADTEAFHASFPSDRDWAWLQSPFSRFNDANQVTSMVVWEALARLLDASIPAGGPPGRADMRVGITVSRAGALDLLVHVGNRRLDVESKHIWMDEDGGGPSHAEATATGSTESEVDALLEVIEVGGSEKVPARAMVGVLNGIRSLMAREAFTQLDSLLERARPELMTPVAMISLLRYPFSIRERLRNWPSFLGRVKDELSMRGADVGSILRGLDGD